MEYKGYEGLTQAQIKEKIIVEFYTKGTADGKKQPKMEFKKHIGIAVSRMYGFDEGTATDLGEDLFQIVFEELWKYTPEKFCDTFFKDSGEFNSSRFFGTLGNILNWQGLSSTSGMISKMLKCSSLDSGNLSFNVDAHDEENYCGLSDYLNLIEDEYDETNISQVEKILSYLDEDELKLWKLRLQKKSERDVRLNPYEGQKLNEKLIRIKAFLDNKIDSINAVYCKRVKEKYKAICKKDRVVKVKALKPVKVKQPTSNDEKFYKRLLTRYKFENGKSRRIKLPELFTIVKDEILLAVTLGTHERHELACKIFELLLEDEKLSKQYRQLSMSVKMNKCNNPLNEQRVKLDLLIKRRLAIDAELKKLEDDRKRIILSDATNGSTV